MKVSPVPAGFHTVTPYLSLKGVAQVIEFMQQAFGATVDGCHKMPDGTIVNAEVSLGNSKVMLGEARGGHEPWPAMLYLYVDDADATYARAVKAGGKSVLEPTDHFYGDRSGGVEDSAGNQWWIATRKENLSPDEIKCRMSEMAKD